MVDIRPYSKQELHVTVWLEGKCKYCKFKNEMKTHDYGVLTFEELDKKLDETKHELVPIVCKKCGSETTPESLLYRDELRKMVISEVNINYGHTIDGEQAHEIEEAFYEKNVLNSLRIM